MSAREDGWLVRAGQDPGSLRGPWEDACARDLIAHDLGARDHRGHDRGRDRVGHREPGPADAGHRQRGPADAGHRRRVCAGADGRGRDYADAGVRRRHCCAECAQRVTKGRPGAGGPGRTAAGEGGRDAQGGRAQTAERIAAGAEMIIALPRPAPSGEPQVTAVAAAPEQGRRENNNGREGAGPSP